MTSDNPKLSRSKRARRGVRGAYTFRKLKDDIQAAYDAMGPKKSLRVIAKTYGVTHAAVARVLAGIEPHNPKIRQAFGLTDLHLAPVCPKCGSVHVTKRCTNKSKPARPRRDWKRAATWAASMLLFMNAR